MKLKLILICILVFILTSCSNMANDDFFSMDTYMTISVDGTEEDTQAVKQEIYRIDNLLKRDNIDKENIEIKELIQKSLEISKATDGAFDITVAPLCDLWGFWNNNFRVPTEEEIMATLGSIGYTKYNSEMPIDFGGIGKGYAGDKAAEILKNRAVKSAILSLGGNIQTIGSKANGEPWIVAIKNPLDTSKYIGTVKVSDMAVVTSGGYERYFEEQGIVYEHILDTKTGYPAKTDIASSTIICKSGLYADSLSTAFYVFGSEKAKEFCDKNQNKLNGIEFSAILVLRNGEIVILGNDFDFEKSE